MRGQSLVWWLLVWHLINFSHIVIQPSIGLLFFLCIQLYMFKGLYGVCTKYGHSKLDEKLNHRKNIGWENCFFFPGILFLLCDDDSNDWNQFQSCGAGNAGFHQIRHHELGYLHAQPLCRGPVTPGFGGLCCWQQPVKEPTQIHLWAPWVTHSSTGWNYGSCLFSKWLHRSFTASSIF